jgi:glycine oxidase
MADVVIAGGGVIGCATAYYLAREGASVVLLERGELASEASGASAGMLAALSGEGADRGAAFEALCDYSLRVYNDLFPELDKTGIDIRRSRTGVLHLALTSIEADGLRARLAKRAPGTARLLEGEAIQREEPQASRKTVLALLTDGEEYVDAPSLTRALAKAAQMHGAEVRTNAGVTGFGRTGDKIRGVRTTGGVVEGETVLLAAGPWTKELARRLGANVPVRPVRGQMLSLDGPTQPLRQMIWGTPAYLLPREDGQTYVGATVEDVGYRKQTTTAALARMRRGAAALIPALASAKQRRAWAGLRPGTPDGLPILGRLPGWQNVWVATGHYRNGILMAPGSSLLMARSLLAGKLDARLSTFTPERFGD